MSEAVSPPLDPFQLLTLTGSCQSFKNLGKRPVGTLGLMLISRLSAKLSLPLSGFPIGTCSLTLKRPFARARHAAAQRGNFFDRLVVEGAQNRWETLPLTTHLLQVPVRKSFLIALPFAIATMRTPVPGTATLPRLACAFALAIGNHSQPAEEMQEVFLRR